MSWAGLGWLAQQAQLGAGTAGRLASQEACKAGGWPAGEVGRLASQGEAENVLSPMWFTWDSFGGKTKNKFCSDSFTWFFFLGGGSQKFKKNI